MSKCIICGEKEATVPDRNTSGLEGGKMSKIPIHDAYGRIVGYDQDSTAFGKLDLDMEDHGHLINEATGEIGKLQSEINRQIRKLHSSILWSPKSSKHGTR